MIGGCSDIDALAWSSKITNSIGSYSIYADNTCLGSFVDIAHISTKLFSNKQIISRQTNACLLLRRAYCKFVLIIELLQH